MYYMKYTVKGVFFMTVNLLEVENTIAYVYNLILFIQYILLRRELNIQFSKIILLLRIFKESWHEKYIHKTD